MKAGRNDVRYVLTMVVLMLPLSGRASETIHVRLMDNAIQIDTDTTRAGNVTFEVSNETKSNTQHEFVVLRTDTDEARLPVHNGQVTESRFRKMGEVEDLDKHSTKRLSLKLVPGHYVLICNRPGHYEMGMHKSFVVER